MDDECYHPVSDEECPKPMIDKQPVQKVENAADKFSNAHQAVYEAREKPSRDIIEVVENHNQAHPLLKDELDKRRSAMKITPATCNVSTMVIPFNENEKCNKCIQVERAYTMRRYKRYNNNLRRRGTLDNRSKTIVSRSRRMQKRGQKFGRNLSLGVCYRCRQNAAVNKRIGTENCHQHTSLNLDRRKNEVDDISTTNELNRTQPQESQSTSKQNKDDVLSIGTSGYPDTSLHSFVSYHSFASMDNEPTVEM